MDFARKQLEKFGWTEGSGLGKNNQGMLQAIKPTLKTGKEGMGYDFSKELVDTWWTRAYDDSLSRINVNTDGDTSGTVVGVTLNDDDKGMEEYGNTKGALSSSAVVVERPFEKMRRRMMKATFTTFSKGATLSNGEMVVESNCESSDSNDSDVINKSPSKVPTSLTDEELFKACGGRTAHKAARFGLKLNGKLARIAAQEEAAKALLSRSQQKDTPVACVGAEDHYDVIEQRYNSGKDKKKKKKKKSKCEAEDTTGDIPVMDNNYLSANTESFPDPLGDTYKDFKKSMKKQKKRKYLELEQLENSSSSKNNNVEITEKSSSIQAQNSTQEIVEDVRSSNNISSKSHKMNKKSKKLKLSAKNDNDEEAFALLSE